MNKYLENKLKNLLENTGDMALKRRAGNIIGGLDLKDGERILEVGCGDGYYLHLLSNLGVKLYLTGTDHSRHDLERARKNLNDKKIKLVYGDLMEKLPFKNNLFDKIVMSEVSEHLPDDVKGLKEVFRVLKKRGTLCLTVPNHNYPLFWDPLNWILEHFINIHVKSGFFAGLWNQHERLYKPQEIEKVTKKAGFKIEEVKSLTWWCLPFNHYMVNLVARGLAAGKFSKDTHLALSKYAKKVKKPLLLNLAFRFVNTLDKLNDVYQPKNFGVSVFVKAVK